MSVSNNRIRAHNELCRLKTNGRALSISMQATVMDVVVREMSICSKLGPNLSEMEFRIFVRMQKVIWDHLLASKAINLSRNMLFIT